MRIRLIFSMLLIIGVGNIVAQSYERLHIMSINVRYDNPSDGKHGWRHRKDAVAKLVHEMNADIVGAQEVIHRQLEDMLELMPGFTYVGVGRADGDTKGEYSPIFFSATRFELLNSGTFWLSDMPDSIASVGWDASMERIATWAILKSNESGQAYAVFNTHFDHRGQMAQYNSIMLLMQKMSELAPGLPIILTGDLNATPTSAPIQFLRHESGWLDASLVAEKRKGVDWTFHNFGKLRRRNRPQIDYVFLSKEFNVLLYQSIFEKVRSSFHSDHNPLFVSVDYPLGE